MKRGSILGCMAIMFSLVGCDPLPETKKPEEKPPAKEAAVKPATLKVEQGAFKIETSCKGIFESEDMIEVFLSPEGWTPEVRGILQVMTAVDQGTIVKKGDTVVGLDLSKIDQLLKDQDAERRLADLAFKMAEDEIPILEKFTPLELEAAERAKKIADEDLKRYLELERAYFEKSANFDVKFSENYLQYVKEELKQLEKMYRSKDLTEETEEIILKRQRDVVERMTFSLEGALMDRDWMLKFALPRKDFTVKENAVKQTLALDKARHTLPQALEMKKLTLAKTRYDRQKAYQKYQDLKKDRENMTVKAPVDGIVYYGKCVRGQWSTASAVAGKLQRGGLLGPEEVFMTIVKPRPLFVRVTVEEKDLHLVKKDQEGKIVPVPFPDSKLAGRIEEVSAIPITPGNFEAKIKIDRDKDAGALMPGMNCNVKLVSYKKENALTVTASAVFAEELDEDRRYVYLWSKEGKPVKKSVKVGKTSGTKIEILEGLQAGDEILSEKPAGEKKADEPKKGSL